MTEINRQPQGLANFLSVQAGGRNPDDLSQSVRPVVNIEPFYQPDRLRAAKTAFNLNVQQLQELIVPEGEIWKLLSVSLQGQNAAANHQNFFSFWLERIPGQGLNGVPIADVNQNIVRQSNGVNTTQVYELRHPLVLTGGQRVVLSFDNGDTNPSGGFFYCIYVLLDVGNA